jgi:hypothetical protein
MAGRLLDLPALPRDGEGPVFSEPWQAHAFALAVRLAEAGHFSWAEWTAFLSQEIRMAQERANPDARAREPGQGASHERGCGAPPGAMASRVPPYTSWPAGRTVRRFCP